MSAFDLTDADAQGLDALAAAQLRLALRFAERAEAAEDDDAACKLARSSERAARSYRQALLIKMKLRRGVPTELPERRSDPPSPTLRRAHALGMAMERIADEERLDEDDADALMEAFDDAIDVLEAEPGFTEGDLTQQLARIYEAVKRPLPTWADEWRDAWAAYVLGDPEPADSS
jgi:hypothetical protein